MHIYVNTCRNSQQVGETAARYNSEGDELIACVSSNVANFVTSYLKIVTSFESKDRV